MPGPLLRVCTHYFIYSFGPLEVDDMTVFLQITEMAFQEEIILR
jgi:hypothetical protein